MDSVRTIPMTTGSVDTTRDQKAWKSSCGSIRSLLNYWNSRTFVCTNNSRNTVVTFSKRLRGGPSASMYKWWWQYSIHCIRYVSFRSCTLWNSLRLHFNPWSSLQVRVETLHERHYKSHPRITGVHQQSMITLKQNGAHHILSVGESSVR